MAGFEDLIRGTLRKHGDATPEARAAIYHSSRQALERMLSQNQNLDLAAQTLQRQRLESAIADIEADYLTRPAVPTAPVAPAATAQPQPGAAATPPIPPSQPPSPPSPSPVAPEVSSGPGPAEAPRLPLRQPPEPRPAPPPQSAPPSQPVPPVQPTVSPPAPSGLAPPPEPRLNTPPREEIQVRPGIEVPPIPVPPSVSVPTPSPQVEPPRPPAPPAGQPAPAPQQPSPPQQVPQAVVPPPQVEQPIPQPVPAEPGSEPAADEAEVGGVDTRDAYSEAYAASVSKERKPYAKLLLWTIILVGIGVAAWWAINFGPALIKQQLGGSVPNPGQTIESGQFVPGQEDGWVTAFTPSNDSVNIDSGGRGTAEVVQNQTESFVRLASNAGGNENNLRIQIPRGVMLPLKGEAVTIEILIKSSGKTGHQFAVYCDFGDMGSCGRKRFKAGDRVEAQLFDVLLNNADLAANEEAYLNFNTDLGGEGRGIDIYAIRLRPNS